MKVRNKFLIGWGIVFCIGVLRMTKLHATPLPATQPEPAAVAQTEPVTDTRSDHTAIPPIGLILPFLLLLCMIATGPLLYARYWHKHYPKIAILLAALVLAYYLLVLHNGIKPLEACVDYIQFIALIAALYLAASGILITIHQPATPLRNTILLLTGALLSNLIGTTGASMLLIRPYIRLNQNRIQVYHIVFFIFIVSNIGGCLTPIGDPPLFLGFLKGVPFFWTLTHHLLPWLTALVLLSSLFYFFDTRNLTPTPPYTTTQPAIEIIGKRNIGWLALVIPVVFLDPHIVDWVPAIAVQGHRFSFVRELILLGIAWGSYRYADPKALQGNQFSLAPLKEVVIIFIGIFGTMLPALEWISAFAHAAGSTLITPNLLYWVTGILSSCLDNAPTYLTFSAASMAAQGADITQVAAVKAYALGHTFVHSTLRLQAIAVASVFFGAMTYIGNGPNFMVKSMAEQVGIPMPSFVRYIGCFSIPLLLPILMLIWLLFFAFSY